MLNLFQAIQGRTSSAIYLKAQLKHIDIYAVSSPSCPGSAQQNSMINSASKSGCALISFSLCAGNVLHLSSISPGLVVIAPPEKLILEVQSSGAYHYILWKRNGLAYLFPPWPFPSTPDRFFYFFDAYVREPTTEEHLGLYEVRLVEDAGQNTTDAPIQSFTVARYGKWLWCVVILKTKVS